MTPGLYFPENSLVPRASRVTVRLGVPGTSLVAVEPPVSTVLEVPGFPVVPAVLQASSVVTVVWLGFLGILSCYSFLPLSSPFFPYSWNSYKFCLGYTAATVPVSSTVLGFLVVRLNH